MLAEWFLEPQQSSSEDGGTLEAIRRSLGRHGEAGGAASEHVGAANGRIDGQSGARSGSFADPVLGSGVSLFSSSDPHVVRLATTTRLREETYDAMFSSGAEEIARAEQFAAEASSGRKALAGGGGGSEASGGGADIVSGRGEAGKLDADGTARRSARSAFAPPPPGTPLALSGTQGVGAYQLFRRAGDGRPVPRLRALQTPVRAVVLPVLDSLAVGALASVAGSLAEVVPPQRLWLQDPARYHATLFHASTADAPKPLPGEGAVDREAAQIALTVSKPRSTGTQGGEEGGNPDEEALLRLYETAVANRQLKSGETQVQESSGQRQTAASGAAGAGGEGGGELGGNEDGNNGGSKGGKGSGGNDEATVAGSDATAKNTPLSRHRSTHPSTTALPRSELPYMACPPTLVLDRIVVAPGGAVVACWQVADGSDPRELRAALRRALPDAPPEQVVSNPDILHTTVARYIPPDMPDSMNDRNRRIALRAQADDLRALEHACERATKALCGTPFDAPKLWHVEEHDHLALALRGRYAIRELPLQRCEEETQP